MEPIIVCPFIYVLRCEDECLYIGITHDLNKRFAQHLNGTGAKWTRLHKPLSIIDVITEGCTLELEREITEKYCALYGREKVRGGSWTRC